VVLFFKTTSTRKGYPIRLTKHSTASADVGRQWMADCVIDPSDCVLNARTLVNVTLQDQSIMDRALDIWIKYPIGNVEKAGGMLPAFADMLYHMYFERVTLSLDRETFSMWIPSSMRIPRIFVQANPLITCALKWLEDHRERCFSSVSGLHSCSQFLWNTDLNTHEEAESRFNMCNCLIMQLLENTYEQNGIDDLYIYTDVLTNALSLANIQFLQECHKNNKSMSDTKDLTPIRDCVREFALDKLGVC
jgi:hypothetical protein